MDESLEVVWTKRSLVNAIAIKKYLSTKFGAKSVSKFESLLKQFEQSVSNFPTLYPASKSLKLLRRAVIHKNTTVYYIFDGSRITVVAIKDNRQHSPN